MLFGALLVLNTTVNCASSYTNLVFPQIVIFCFPSYTCLILHSTCCIITIKAISDKIVRQDMHVLQAKAALQVCKSSHVREHSAKWPVE